MIEIFSWNRYKKEETMSTDDGQKKETIWSKIKHRIGYYFILLWVTLGLASFQVSVACFGIPGSITFKIMGVLIALLTGPFYWVYFILNPHYCRIHSVNIIEIPNHGGSNSGKGKGKGKRSRGGGGGGARKELVLTVLSPPVGKKAKVVL